jgi:hypothetical protein
MNEPGVRSRTYRIHEFDPNQYDWEDWQILLDTYISVEGIIEDNQKRNILIASLGVVPFKSLIALCKPRKPTDYSYTDLITKLRTNYTRVTFDSTERIKFFQTKQEGSQSLPEFANVLRGKTTTCNFPLEFYEQALITAFVGGLSNEYVRKHLMQQNLETFEKTVNIARTIESVLIQGANVKGDLSEDLSLLKIHKQNKQTTNNKFKLICFSCGLTGHPRAKCRLRNAKCNICHKTGHIAKACRSRQFNNNDNIINTIYTTSINTIPSTKTIQVKLLIDDNPVKFQLDTGSPVTLVDESVWKQMGCPLLEPIQMHLNSFTGHLIQLKGQKVVNVKYKNQQIQLNLHFLAGVGNNILGLDWIHALHINSKSLNDIISDGIMAKVNVQFKNLPALLIHYNEIFKEGLGCCKVKAHLYVKPNVTPKFFKPRSLPFAYRQLVEMELNRLVNEGVLEPISISRWAAPIVVVPKPGGKVRICADLSTGVNQALDIDQYPLPKPDDLFTVLNGGEKFTKIDLSDAYLQVQLDDDSKELLVINTHKGLFRFNRLPFGIASAPSIFQKIMDQMIAGLDGTICYLDDIIVTGKNTIDHLNNLQQLFIRIREYGFHLNKQKCSFLQNQVEYLGFIVNKHGIHSSPSKTSAIIKMPRPGNISQLRSFLGMVNHYAKFIPKLTERLFPLYELLKMNKSWNWNVKCEKSFKSIKEILISPLALVHYDPALPLVMAADASNVGVGAVIYHRYPNGSEKVIAHASKNTNTNRTKIFTD